jgi:hypothetical protein
MLWAARASSDCGGVSDRRRRIQSRERPKSGLAVRTTWAEAKAKVGAAKNLPSTFRALPFTAPRPVAQRRTRAIKFLHLRAVSHYSYAASASRWVGVGALIDRCRKQTPCRIARRYDNNKANANCDRVIAINLVLGA